MLVLGRNRNETIVITAPDGRRIVIEPVDCRRDYCRIGVTADEDFLVNRGEVQAKIDAQEGGGR